MNSSPPRGTLVSVVLTLPNNHELKLRGKVIRAAPPPPGEVHHRVGLALELDKQKRGEIHSIYSHAQVVASGMNPAQGQQKPQNQQPSAPSRSSSSQNVPKAASSARPPMMAPRESDDETVIGIDFGTSYCSMSYMTDEGPKLVPDETGRTAIPSIVWFRGPGDYVVGHEARENVATDPTKTFPSIKRLLGCKIDDEAAAPVLMSLACAGHAGPNRSIVFEFNGEQFSPILIASIILKHLKFLAESHLRKEVRKVVLAVPISFREQQRADIEKAVRIAGLDIVEVIPEPVAAAMAYGHDQNPNGIVGVYDFGGGTFDFCAMSPRGNQLKIIGTGGDPWLGGDDMDLALAGFAADTFWRNTKIDLRRRAVEWQRVLHACEEAKVYLSLMKEIDVFVPEVARTQQGMIDFAVQVRRTEFENLIETIVQNSIAVCQNSLRQARINVIDVAELVLTGGTTKIPAVRRAAQQFFGREPHVGLHPEQAVVLGTAIKAAEHEGRRISRPPLEPKAGQTFVATSIGLAVSGGETTHIIQRATPLPLMARRIFSTTKDGQSRFNLKIVAGENRLTAQNTIIGRVDVPGLQPRPAGHIKVEVIFEMNSPTRLDVTARDLMSGRRFCSTFAV